MCISSCKGIPDGNYGVCSDCKSYIVCNSGRQKIVTCSPGTAWDSSSSSCKYHSSTCPLDGICKYICIIYTMGLLPDTQNWGMRMRRECQKRFPRHRVQRKPIDSDPDMHHGTCVTHVPWCMSGLLTRGDGANVPGIPGACVTRNFTYLVRGICMALILAIGRVFEWMRWWSRDELNWSILNWLGHYCHQ